MFYIAMQTRTQYESTDKSDEHQKSTSGPGLMYMMACCVPRTYCQLKIQIQIYTFYQVTVYEWVGAVSQADLCR